MSNDIRWCSGCGEMIEAGGDSNCTCTGDFDHDDRGDWKFHCCRDEEAESRA